VKGILLVASLLSLWSAACADDIVFSAARARRAHGAYFQAGLAHLYRVMLDGSGLRQLTSGDTNDMDPERSPDGKHVLFWRQDKNDLVGQTWLCSIAPDGTDLKKLRRMTEQTLGSPIDALPGRIHQSGGR
jgi:Tol biopolymer transport system component